MLSTGERVGNFRLPDLHGKPSSLLEFLDRGPAVLAFFKISCPVCQLTLPFLNRIAASGQVPVVGISQDDAAATDGFRERYGLDFPLLIDAKPYAVSGAFKITHVPSVFVVEKDSSISAAFDGFSRAGLEEIGKRFHARVFEEGESVPEFRPG